MVGSSSSISDANVVLNTAVAEVLKGFADLLENTDDFETTLHNLIRDTIRTHKRILFNGNGYDDNWVAEAEDRGLLNLRTTPDALSHFLDEKNIRLFSENKIFSETEMRSRYEIMQENYCKLINIEALTMVDMARKEILPAVSGYVRTLSETVVAMRQACSAADTSVECELIETLSTLNASAWGRIKTLESELIKARGIADHTAQAMYHKDNVIPAMNALRAVVDEMETLTAASAWPMPTYGELLFGVN
jgi:glutamine synthetase